MLLVPITLRAAQDFVAAHHRHLGPPRGHRFSVAVKDGGEVVGVAIAGRPVARHLDDGLTLELLRVCTLGTPNACSMLSGAVRRAKAAGWRRVAEVRAGQWGRRGRPRAARPALTRWRWECVW